MLLLLQENRQVHEELKRVLAKGLRLEVQGGGGGGRDSLIGSSGYSSQTNTPSCCEDAAAAQGRYQRKTL